MAKRRICAIDGCGKRHLARGWCGMHYRRWKLYGDPLTTNPRRAAMADWLETTAAANTDDCIAWPWLRDDMGYGLHWLDAEDGMVRVHRLMCERVHGDPASSDLMAIHSCGKGHEGCANPRHLRWGTVAENSVDMIEHGRSTRGVRNAQAKLSEDDVRQIRALRGRSSQRQIADRFGIVQSALANIQTGKRWGWVA